MIHSSFAYNGKDFSIVDNHTSVQIAGNSILFWNTSTGQKEYIWSEKNGYCRVTSNFHSKLVAAAEYGLNPECHIYRYPIDKKNQQPVHRFPIDTTVKAIEMVFSRDGKYLLIIGGVPDFKISIFDVESAKKLVLPDTKLPCKPQEFIQAKFNPANRNQFAILSQTSLYTFILKQAYDVTEKGERKILGESFRLEHTVFRDENPQMTFSKMIWDNYGRVHLCTDLPLIVQVDPKTSKIENQVQLSSKPTTFLLTQKHMIVSLEEGILQWFRLDIPPEVVLNEKDAVEQCLKVLQDVDQEWSFNVKIAQTDEPDFISHIHYTQNFKTLIAGTQSGVFGTIEIEAESIDEEEEEEDQNNKKEKKILQEEFKEIGRFHTKIVNGIRELGETTQLVTISQDHQLNIWEATNQQVLSQIYQPAPPTAVDASVDGSSIFVGTAMGAFRVYDVRNRIKPRLVQQLRFFEESFPINHIISSQDGKYILVSSVKSRNVFILSQKPEDKFKVIGYITFDGYVLSSCFAVVDGNTKILALLSNSLLAGANVPLSPVQNRIEPIPPQDSNILYRKVDKDSYIVMQCISNGDIYVTGEDKLLKRYEYPNEKISQIDWKRAPQSPIEEHFSHSVGTSCWYESREFKFLATGGKDGSVILRQINNIANMPNPIKAHSVISGGVTALCISKNRSTLYTAGGDGTIFAYTIGGKQNPNQPIQADQNIGVFLNQMSEVEKLPGSQIKIFKEVLLEEFNKSQEQSKAAFKVEMMKELSKIKDGLMTLIAENDRCTEIERLERDEFVVDINRRDQVNEEAEKECEEIRQEAEKTVLRLELLRQRVKKSTWDTMEQQQKAIKSIQSDTLIFNYPIRKKTDLEKKALIQIINTRKIELNEKLNRIEEKLQESLDEEEFSKFTEKYFMSRFREKPSFEEDGCIQAAAEAYALKDAEKKAKKDKLDANLNQLQNSNQQGKKQPILKISKGKLGNKTKKKGDGGDEEGMRGKDKKQLFEIRGMEEMHWQVVSKLQQLEDLKQKILNHDKPTKNEKEIPLNIMDIIYEPFELYTDIRKRNQIEIIKNVIFELKKDFNKEFEDLEKNKEDQLFVIKEKNDAIREILQNLKQKDNIFEPQSHPLEDPKRILTLDPSEIKVEKYLTKEERARLEEERKRQEEREAALKGDNVGQRGLKTMLGGTELILKKDKGNTESELVREDWMNKPVEEMTNEEQEKLKEFEQKEKEFKDKQRKAWEQDLKKIKSEIIEIQLRFEEKLLTLFKKKLFIDVRVLEQELYQIRLVIMLHDGKETRFDEKKYRQEMARLEKEKAEKEELINTFTGFAQDLETRLSDDSSIREQEKELRKMFQDAQNYKPILAFVRTGKPKKTVIPGEANPREQELSAGIVDLDPFSKIDKLRVKETLKEEEERETFDFERDNIAGLNEDEFDRLVQERQSRAEMEKDKEKLQKQIQQLQEHISYIESQYRNIEESYEGQILAQKKAADRINKIRYNFETIVYVKQGQVEVPQLPVATDYKDAILISKKVIDYENHEIVIRGDNKVKLMNAISDFKTGLKRVLFSKKRLDLEILDFEERAKDVQLYRVTKQTQEIIQGKHQKKDEEEKKRLENQIKQLEENAMKRIKTVNDTKQKLKREIRDKRMESEQLETKARQLQNNVEQRQQIMNLKSNTKTDNDADPSKKIKEIAHKRKLLDIAKQQTEDIEVLRDELDRLRARTFPSFAHLHNKPGYPDEN